MKKTLFLLIAFAFLFSLPFSAAAVECGKDIQAAISNLEKMTAKMDQVPEKDRQRIQNFLDDGLKMAREAKEKCDGAKGSFNILEAKAKALVAQGNIAAATLLIKDAIMNKK